MVSPDFPRLSDFLSPTFDFIVNSGLAGFRDELHTDSVLLLSHVDAVRNDARNNRAAGERVKPDVDHRARVKELLINEADSAAGYVVRRDVKFSPIRFCSDHVLHPNSQGHCPWLAFVSASVRNARFLLAQVAEPFVDLDR